MTATVHLKPQKCKSLRRLHPWVFSGAIAKVKGEPQLGDTVSVHSAEGDWLGAGAWSPHSQIRVRIWSFQANEIINEAFLNNVLVPQKRYAKA